MSDLVEIGRIVKTHGLQGRVKAVSYLESEDLLEGLGEVIIRKDRRADRKFRINRVQPARKSFFLELEGVNDPDSAGELVGSGIFIPAALLGELPEGEYYWHQIIGLKVVTETGGFLGNVSAILPAGGAEVYVCSGGEREILLPAIEGVVLKIDLEKGEITASVPEGL